MAEVRVPEFSVRPVRPGVAHVLLRPDHIEVLTERRRWWRPALIDRLSPVPVPAQGADGAPGAQAPCPFAAVLPQALQPLQAGTRVQVWVHDALLRQWTSHPPSQATRLSDLSLSEALRFQQTYDEGLHGWQVRSEMSTMHPWLSVAWPRSWQEALMAALDQAGLRLRSISPEGVGVWNHWHRQIPAGHWFGRCLPEGVQIGVTGQGVLQGWRWFSADTSAAPDAASPDQAVPAWRAFIQREAWRMGCAEPAGLALCGPRPSGPSPMPGIVWLGTHADIATCLGASA